MGPGASVPGCSSIAAEHTGRNPEAQLPPILPLWPQTSMAPTTLLPPVCGSSHLKVGGGGGLGWGICDLKNRSICCLRALKGNL